MLQQKAVACRLSSLRTIAIAYVLRLETNLAWHTADATSTCHLPDNLFTSTMLTKLGAESENILQRLMTF